MVQRPFTQAQHLLEGIGTKWQLTEDVDQERFCKLTRSAGNGGASVTVEKLRGMSEGWRFLRYDGSHFWAVRPEGEVEEADAIDDRQRVEEALADLTRTAMSALKSRHQEAEGEGGCAPSTHPPAKGRTPEAWLRGQDSKAAVDPRYCLGLTAAASEAKTRVGLDCSREGWWPAHFVPSSQCY